MAPEPVLTDDQPVARPHAWVGFGLVLIALGAFAAGDTLNRLSAAWEFFAREWPVLLLVLAGVNVARSVFRLESVLAPGLLAMVALVALALRRGVATSTVLNVLLPAVVVIVGALLLLVSLWGRRKPMWTRFAVTGFVRAPAQVVGVVRPRVFLGELQVDFTRVIDVVDLRGESSGALIVHATVFLGCVRLVLPRNWSVGQVRTEGGLLVHLSEEPMPTYHDSNAPQKVDLRVLGVAGLVKVTWV
ncbi:hypothetical protein Lesp02_09510 [Lentzea sp. NBRC 105346]|uniref:hypothetical protein n=1 Tax=Lentzea sp. NBRC 105346 TaxID=3032205 RepID=UPI00249F9BB0|nr:hypothetical protein [Lentzea sp. NBRC 105346]GLZ28761.1 hypothetical protein Lesp02_09510 [Lentzea sp. NBRC 105346]